MRELAEILGISRTSVSLVLQGKGDAYRISKETQKRILEKADELDFRPNYFASALNKGRTGVIGVIFPDVFENFMGRVVRGIESVIYDRGYTMMLSTSRFDNALEKHIVDQLLYRGVDGFLTVFSAPFSHQQFNYDHLRRIQNKGIPLVFIDRYLEGFDVPMVIADDYAKAKEGTARLIEDGIRRLVCISLDLSVSTIQARISGYKDAIRQAGFSPEVIRLHSCDPQSDDLSSQMDLILDEMQERGELDRLAFFTSTSGIADKAAWIIRRRGLLPGKDIGLIRFGSTSEWLDTGIIDIPQPHEEMGSKAAEMVLEMIEQHRVPENVILP